MSLFNLAPLKTTPRPLADIERQYILRTLITFHWNRTHTAKALEISIRTVRNKLAEYRKQGYPTRQSEMNKLLAMKEQVELGIAPLVDVDLSELELAKRPA